MIKFIHLLLFLTLSQFVFSQATLFSDDFESGGLLGLSIDNLTPNFWITDNCALNGPSAPGSKAMYITIGGSDAGCGPTGAVQYAYTNAPAGIQQATNYRAIDASCASNLELNLDYRVDGAAGSDYLEIIYSTDASNWFAVGSQLANSGGWQNTTISLPPALNFTNFYLGVRFVYNANTVVGFPAAVDNFVVTGTDTEAPQITCPVSVQEPVSAGCLAVCDDYTKALLSISDNCTDSIDLIVTQDIPEFTVIPGGPGTSQLITITASDESGNQTQCTLTVQFIDADAPSLTCPSDTLVYVDANCEGTLEDYTAEILTGDNCTALADLIITQSPAPGTLISGSSTLTVIQMTVVDEAGNSAVCQFNAVNTDTLVPTILCPPDTVVYANAFCEGSIADYTNAALVNDNCPSSLSVTQSPVPGFTITDDVQITLTVTGNPAVPQSCSFTAFFVDTLNPSILCPLGADVYLDSNCEALIPDFSGEVIISDNCTAVPIISQDPIAGTLVSGTTTLITMTVSDDSNNSFSCVFNASLVDTLVPVVICPGQQLIPSNANCEYIMPDLSSLMAVSDNCTPQANLVISQNPVSGSVQTGLVFVTMTTTDEAGNSSVCQVPVAPQDTIDPQLICPTLPTVDNGSSCDFVLPDYSTFATITDNCSGFVVMQNPVPGTVINTGTTTIQLEVVDLSGNAAQCAFDLLVVESVPPSIVCPSDIVSCDPQVIYLDPVFNDNCDAVLAQTDGSGLSSGDFYPIGITAQEFTVTDLSGNTQSCSFTVEVLIYPSPAVISSDSLLLCGTTSAVLMADPIASGTGLWTLESGNGTFNNAAANATGVNNIGIGTNVYVWTVSSPLCGSVSDTITVIVSQIDLQASTQDTIFSCSDAVVELLANAPLYGTGTWSTDGGGIITAVNSPISSSTTVNGWQSFVWTIVNGSCPATSDTVHVFAVEAPVIQQSDTLLCFEDASITLSGSDPQGTQVPSWQVISGGATVNPSDQAVATVSNLIPGNTVLVYALEHETCETVRDSILISVVLCDGYEPIIPTVITPGNLDGKNDVFAIDFLHALYPDCHVLIFNRWGSVVYESTGYEVPWDGTYNNEQLPMGTYFYKIELNDDAGTTFKGDISILR